jgi:hypothetical protein
MELKTIQSSVKRSDTRQQNAAALMSRNVWLRCKTKIRLQLVYPLRQRSGSSSLRLKKLDLGKGAMT